MDGTVASMTYPSTKTVTYTYDQAGRVSAVSRGAEAIASSVVYAAHGPVQSLALGNGLFETVLYNDRLQPYQMNLGTSSGSGNVWSLVNTYGAPGDNNGNVLEQQLTVPGVAAARQLYKYDQANRLTWFTEGAANAAAETCATAAAPLCERFGYDQWGNRLLVDSAGLGPALSQPDAFSSATNRITTAGFTYDDGAPGPGDLTATPAGTFKYDAENRMVSSTTLLGLTQYVYDAEGRRVKKVAGADVTVYVYDGMGQLAAEYGGTVPATARAYLTADHLGSTRVVTNHDGTEVLRRSDYLPFGEEIPVPGGSWRSGVSGYATPTASTNILFTGQVRDGETGLDYFGARYFSAAQGRFTSPDPFLGSGRAEDPQSWNRYAYGRNNPLRFVDPNGLDYYDQNGNRLGGSGDENNYVVTDEEEIKRIKKSKSVVALNTINSAALLPNPTVAGAIGAAVERSNSPTADDPSGGFHEEGGQWGLDANGSQVILPAAAGAADPTITQGHVSIAIGVPANPADAGRIVTPQGGFHVHPRGQIETASGPSSPGTVFGGTTTISIRNFVQTPSAVDVINAVYPVNIVVGARNRTVYFYNQSGTTATFPLNRLLRLR